MLMQNKETIKPQAKNFTGIKRKALSLSPGEVIKTSYLRDGQTLPLVVEPAADQVDLADWAANNRAFLEEQLLKHGAILFRGFGLKSAADFERTSQSICPELYGEYGDLPREGVGGKVYQSTPYPADKAILFHNESSHLPRWPLKQFFFCVLPAKEGGETPILDCREVYRKVDKDLLKKFADKGLMYVRNFSEGLDVSWQSFFHTEDKNVVEESCRKEGMTCEWTEGNNLRIRQVSRAVAKHPKTGEMVFFNQVQLHHSSCLDSATRKSMLALFKEEDMPRNVYYGDGSLIEDQVMEKLDELFWATSVSFPWREGDLIMVDNMLVAHARQPYVGPRKILVAMGEMISGADLN
jgi:alpha-ketoglutarate-dependent taurine dioxygenase